MKYEYGYYWPECEQKSFDRYVDTLADLQIAVSLVKKPRVCVQAGGHCGVWPKYLSSQFDSVYTFEPEMDNFRCLVRNIKEENVFMFRSFLGEAEKTSGIKKTANTGGHYMKGEGIIPVMTVDSLRLKTLDLLVLDVEGYELQSLSGSSKTICEKKPVIMIEDCGNTEKKANYPQEYVYSFLSNQGYKLHTKLKKDSIWAHSSY